MRVSSQYFDVCGIAMLSGGAALLFAFLAMAFMFTGCAPLLFGAALICGSISAVTFLVWLAQQKPEPPAEPEEPRPNDDYIDPLKQRLGLTYTQGDARARWERLEFWQREVMSSPAASDTVRRIGKLHGLDEEGCRCLLFLTSSVLMEYSTPEIISSRLQRIGVSEREALKIEAEIDRSIFAPLRRKHGWW